MYLSVGLSVITIYLVVTGPGLYISVHPISSPPTLFYYSPPALVSNSNLLRGPGRDWGRVSAEVTLPKLPFPGVGLEMRGARESNQEWQHLIPPLTVHHHPDPLQRPTGANSSQQQQRDVTRRAEYIGWKSQLHNTVSFSQPTQQHQHESGRTHLS